MKSIINKNNYEAFLLDLSEGNLTLAEEKALIDFLVEHPELEVDVEGLPVLAADQAKLDPTFKADLLRGGGGGGSSPKKRDHAWMRFSKRIQERKPPLAIIKRPFYRKNTLSSH